MFVMDVKDAILSSFVTFFLQIKWRLKYDL